MHSELFRVNRLLQCPTQLCTFSFSQLHVVVSEEEQDGTQALTSAEAESPEKQQTEAAEAAKFKDS